MLIRPYIEVNNPDKVRLAIKGLRNWLQMGFRTAVITTKRARFGIYDQIVAACPGLKIIGGEKVVTFLSALDDVRGWTRLADELEECRERIGGGRRFVLDLESAFKAFCKEAHSFDSGRLTDALGALPTDLTYLWRTGPQMSNPVMRKEVGTALAIAAHNRDVCPFTNCWAGPGLADFEPSRRGHEFMRLLSGKGLIAHLCCRGRYWNYADVPGVIANLPDEIMAATIFPGWGGWLSAARRLPLILAEWFRKPPKP